jgi:serine/threonine protein kinase
MNELDIFTEAFLRSDTAERRAYLDQACGSDTALRERIDRLLTLHGSGPALLERRPEELFDALNKGRQANDAPTESLAPEGAAAQLAPFLAASERAGAMGRLGHYDVLEVLGQGGFGIVVKAFDANLYRVVAIKILTPHLAATSPPRKRFVREGRAAAQVKHENVVQIYAIEEQPLPYLVMEFVEGMTLQQKLDREGPVEDPAEVVRLGCQIARGLAAAHDKGLIHRDVKPANILLEAGPDPRAKLTDFGLVRAGDDASLTQSGVILGTPLYMSPEQAHGTALDHRADLFSLGSVLYAMVTGHPPFRAPSTLAVLKRVADDTPRPIREVMADVPEGLCAVIMRLLEKYPDDRFPAAAAVADALGRCLTEPISARPKPGRSRHRLAVGAAALLAVAAGTTLTVWNWDGARTTGAAVPAPIEDRRPQATEEPKSPPPTADADPDRKAAEWIIAHGGRVRVNEVWDTPEIAQPADLPRERYTLTLVTMQSVKEADVALSHLEGLTGLTHLYMGTTSATDAGLSHLRDCTELTVLHMNGTAITDAGLAHLKRLARLQMVAMNDTKITDHGLTYVTSHPNLQSLAVCRTAVSDASLAHLKGLKSLRQLYIAGTRVTEAGLVHLEPHTGLTELDISNLGLGDSQLTRLARLTKLEKLHLYGNPVTDAGLVQLEPFRALIWLDLRATNVTAKGLAMLHAILPRCQIEHDRE